MDPILICGAGLVTFLVDLSLRQLVQTQAYDIIVLLLILALVLRDHNKNRKDDYLPAKTREIAIFAAVTYKILLLYYYAFSNDIAAYLIGFVSSFVVLVLGILHYGKILDEGIRKIMKANNNKPTKIAPKSERLESLM